MRTLYTLNVGDLVSVTLTNGQTYTMTVSSIEAPGSMGTSYASGPRVMAHIRPGGYSVCLSGAEVASWECTTPEPATPATVTLAAAGCLPDSEFYPAEFDSLADAWEFVASEVETIEDDADYLAAHTALHLVDRTQPGSIPAGDHTTYAYSVEISTPEPGYVAHDLTPEDMAKVPAGPFTMLTYPEMIEALSAPSGERPRVYAYLIPEGDQRYGQLARLSSLHYVERYADRLAFAWVSGTTVADMVGRA